MTARQLQMPRRTKVRCLQSVTKLAIDEGCRLGGLAGAEARLHLVMVTARLKRCPYYKTGFQGSFVTVSFGRAFNPFD
jgi:hypothetical protein